MTAPTCTACNLRPTPDQAYLCGTCTLELRTDLATLHDTAEDLDITLANGNRFSTEAGPAARGSEKLPYNANASSIAADARNTLQSWADEVAHERGYYRPLDTINALSHFLAENVDWLRHRDNAPQALDEIQAAARRVLRVIDRPVERWFAGPCWAAIRTTEGTAALCTEELYARVNADTVTCPNCHAEHGVAARRAWLLEQAEDHLVHAALAATALTALGARVPVGTIYSWVHRGRLTAHGVDRHRRPTYRLGDVLDVLRDEAERQTSKTQTRRTA